MTGIMQANISFGARLLSDSERVCRRACQPVYSLSVLTWHLFSPLQTQELLLIANLTGCQFSNASSACTFNGRNGGGSHAVADKLTLFVTTAGSDVESEYFIDLRPPAVAAGANVVSAICCMLGRRNAVFHTSKLIMFCDTAQIPSASGIKIGTEDNDYYYFKVCPRLKLPTCHTTGFSSPCRSRSRRFKTHVSLQVNATQFRVEVPLNNNLGLVNKTVRAKSYQILLGKLAIGGTVAVSTSLAAEAEFGPIEVR